MKFFNIFLSIDKTQIFSHASLELYLKIFSLVFKRTTT